MITLLWPVAAVQSAPVKTTSPFGEVIGPVGTYLPLVAQSKHDTWVLIKATPDPISGFATPGGAMISGSYTVVQALGAAAVSRTGVYSWRDSGFATAAFVLGQPSPQFTHELESSLFSYPADGQASQGTTGTLLCLLHEKAPGQDKFTSVHFVPDGWQEDMLPAVEYLRTHPQLSDSNATSVSTVQVKKLLHNPNPYLVLTALQLLASRKALTPADMDAALSLTDETVIASSVVIAELYSWPELSANAQWLRSKIAAVKSLNQLEGVAFGVSTITPDLLALYSISTEDLPGVPKLPAINGTDFGASLKPLVRQKLNALDPKGGASDERWRNIDAICRQGEQMEKYLPK